MKNNDLISRSELLAKIDDLQGLLHPCDRIYTENIKDIIRSLKGMETREDD